MEELVHTAVSFWQLLELGVANLQALEVIVMEAHPEVVEALQASGLAPELPLLSELKLASKTVVWAWVVGAMPINATRAIRPRIPPKEWRTETHSGVATARD